MSKGKKLKVLDKGFVRVVDIMGDDLTTVNAAKVSYDRASHELGENEIRLIKFLAKHGHTSPFRHAVISFEVYAPLMVARQWWKYVIGSDHVIDAWNESSRRYITEEAKFHVPDSDEWRKKPANSKQGSAGNISMSKGALLTAQLIQHIEASEELYERAMKEFEVAPEQARMFLPAYSMYVRWYWTASVQSVAHMLNQRLESDAQYEFQQYAKAVYTLASEHFPVSINQLLKDE